MAVQVIGESGIVREVLPEYHLLLHVITVLLISFVIIILLSLIHIDLLSTFFLKQSIVFFFFS